LSFVNKYLHILKQEQNLNQETAEPGKTLLSFNSQGEEVSEATLAYGQPGTLLSQINRRPSRSNAELQGNLTHHQGQTLLEVDKNSSRVPTQGGNYPGAPLISFSGGSKDKLPPTDSQSRLQRNLSERGRTLLSFEKEKLSPNGRNQKRPNPRAPDKTLLSFD
jgi:hypothetical protein